MNVLTVNVGSSTVKAAFFELDGSENPVASFLLEGIGGPQGRCRCRAGDGAVTSDRPLALRNAGEAVQALIDELGSRKIDAIGHRLVHGGRQFIAPTRVDAAVIAQLREIVPLAPLHLPPELDAIEQFAPLNVPQVACFDTAFHATISQVAYSYALPRRFADAGLRRYGFHGLSYEFILTELARVAGSSAAEGKVVIAHLGNGASLAAVNGGKGVDTTMGLTPTGGLVMATRPGDLDPEIVLWLLRQPNQSIASVERILQHESGMMGVSGISGDVRDLLQAGGSTSAQLAIDLFARQASKMIAAMAASLNGIETLVFSAGIGEHSAPVRERICNSLTFLGVSIDPELNAAHQAVISKTESRVTVRIIPTSEERMIARHTAQVIQTA